MRKSTWGIAAVVAAGLGLGVVVGPSVQGATPTVQAQVAAPTATAAPTKQAAANNPLRNAFLDQLAASLHVQRSALDSAITNAGTKTVDAAVQQGTLTQAQADAIKARLQAGDVGALLGGRGGAGIRDGHGFKAGSGVHQALFDAAAKALSISADELRTQLQSGQTLAQLAQAHNTTEQAVIDAALAAAKTQLGKDVAAGTITQAQADAVYAQLQQRGAQLFTAPLRGPGGRGHRGDQSTPQQAPTTPQSSTVPGV